VSNSKITPKIEVDGNDLYVVVDGQRVAKRGQPGTQAAKAWIPLKRGWTVIDYGRGAIQAEHRPQEDD